MGRHRDEGLEVWKKSMDLAVEISLRTRRYPDLETFSLFAQANRAVYSNQIIWQKELVEVGMVNLSFFFIYSLGSLNEVENELLIACRLGYLTVEQYHAFINRTAHIKKMLIKLIKVIGT